MTEAALKIEYLSEVGPHIQPHPFGYGSCVDGFDHLDDRRSLSEKYSWSIPSRQALDLIASHGPIVEIGAGQGYWCYLLRKLGVDIVAYDNFSSHGSSAIEAWTKVEGGDTSMAALHPNRTLFLSWPPYDTPMAFDALRKYLDAGGTKLIYIGEPPEGCTGCPDFFKLRQNMNRIDEHDLLQWFGLHDDLTIWEAQV